MFKFNLSILIVIFALIVTIQESQAAELGIITVSKHFDAKNDYNETNPGAYLTAKGYIVGAYYNSYRAKSVFVGKYISTSPKRLVRASLGYGLIWGYGWQHGYYDPSHGGTKILPFVLPTLSIGNLSLHIVGNAAAASVVIDF